MFVSPQEAVVHTVTVVLSFAVLLISIFAYRRKGGGRYLGLTTAFVFLTASELIQFAESFIFNTFIYIPFLDIHLSHLLDMAMLVSFGFALLVK